MNKVDKFTIWVIHFVIVGNIITSKTPEKDVLITPNGKSYENLLIVQDTESHMQTMLGQLPL